MRKPGLLLDEPPADSQGVRPIMKISGTTLVLGATLGLALKGIWARLAYAAGLDVPAVLFYRSAFAAPLVLFSTLWLLRRESRSAQLGSPPLGSETADDTAAGSATSETARGTPLSRGVPFSTWARASGYGAFFALGMYLDFSAIAHLGAGVSRVILFGFPLLVLVFESTAHKRLPSPKRVLGFFVAWLGLVCVASPAFFAGAKWTFSDLIWGFASMATYAIYVYLTGRLSQEMGSVRLTAASNLTTSAVVVALLLVANQGAAPPASSEGLLWVMAMVVVSTVFPYFMMMEGIRRLGSSEASLLSMSGPLVTLFVAYLVLDEGMSALQLVGTALTLFGVGLATSKLPQVAWLRTPRSTV